MNATEIKAMNAYERKRKANGLQRSRHDVYKAEIKTEPRSERLEDIDTWTGQIHDHDLQSKPRQRGGFKGLSQTEHNQGVDSFPQGMDAYGTIIEERKIDAPIPLESKDSTSGKGNGALYRAFYSVAYKRINASQAELVALTTAQFESIEDTLELNGERIASIFPPMGPAMFYRNIDTGTEIEGVEYRRIRSGGINAYDTGQRKVESTPVCELHVIRTRLSKKRDILICPTSNSFFAKIGSDYPIACRERRKRKRRSKQYIERNKR